MHVETKFNLYFFPNRHSCLNWNVIQQIKNVWPKLNCTEITFMGKYSYGILNKVFNPLLTSVFSSHIIFNVKFIFSEERHLSIMRISNYFKFHVIRMHFVFLQLENLSEEPFKCIITVFYRFYVWTYSTYLCYKILNYYFSNR